MFNIYNLGMTHKKEYTVKKFVDMYPRFKSYINTKEFRLILEYLLQNKKKMIWAIDELEITPLEGIGKRLLELPVNFEDHNIRRLTGALIASILSDTFETVSSGNRIKWRPFRTASKYKRHNRVIKY